MILDTFIYNYLIFCKYESDYVVSKNEAHPDRDALEYIGMNKI